MSTLKVTLAASTLHACPQITKLITNYSDLLTEVLSGSSESYVFFCCCCFDLSFKKLWLLSLVMLERFFQSGVSVTVTTWLSEAEFCFNKQESSLHQFTRTFVTGRSLLFECVLLARCLDVSNQVNG